MAGEKILQPDLSYEDLRKQAEDTNPEFQTKLQNIADDLNNDQSGTLRGVEFKGANVKSEDSVQGKISRKYSKEDQPHLHVQDLVRGTLYVDNANQISALEDKIKQQFEVVDTDNRFQSPNEQGFRDINLKLRMPNGHVAELQIHHRGMERVNKMTHKLFEEKRDYDKIAQQRDLEKWEIDRRNELVNEMRDIHGKAAAEARLDKLLAPEVKATFARPELADPPVLSHKFGIVTGQPELEAPAPHMQPGAAMPDRVGGGVRAGASGYGLGAGGYYAYRAYQDGDAAGMTLAGSNIIVSAADTGMDIAQALGKTIAPALSGLATNANVGLMVAEGAYQVYAEEGNFIDADGSLGHKSERAIAATATATSAIGTGMLVGGTGTAGAATGGSLLATGAAAATPIILVGSAAFATVKFGDTMIEYSRLKDDIHTQRVADTGALKFAQSENGLPSLSNYKQSMFSAVKYSHTMRDENMNGLIIRDEETGRITNFTSIDWTDPKNMAEFERMLDTQIAVQQAIKDENSSFLPDLFRNVDAIDNEFFATTELMMLNNAKDEVAMFKQELAPLRADPALGTKHGALDIEGHPDYITVSIAAEQLRGGKALDPVQERDVHDIMGDADTPSYVIDMLKHNYGSELEEILPAVEPAQQQVAAISQQPLYNAGMSS